jgi:hypothetical protein
MAITDTVLPENGLINNSINSLGNYSWVLWIFLGIFIFGTIIFFIAMMRRAKKQWTHKLVVRRIINNSDDLSQPDTIRMKRFPDKKLTDFFILEKPLLGTFIFQSTGKYSDTNTFSIIIDSNNRIYTEKASKLDRTKGIMSISAVHPNVDTRWHLMLESFDKMDEIKPGTDWAKIGKWAMIMLLIIGSIIVGIVALQEHTKQVTITAERDKAMAAGMIEFAGAMAAMESSVLTQAVLFEAIKEMYGEAKMKQMVSDFNSNEYFDKIRNGQNTTNI